jgi:hypothetical protein
MAAARALTLILAATIGCDRMTPPPRNVASPPASRPVLAGDGVGCLRIGVPLAALSAGCEIVADRMVPGPEGMVERRADIIVAGDTLAATVVRDSVWRVAVTVPTLATADGLGVGSEAGAMLQRQGSRVIGGEGRLFITLADHCGMSFELAVPRELLSLPPDQAASRIPSGSRVTRILLFGCEAPV